jgi:hypothetical protein
MKRWIFLGAAALLSACAMHHDSPRADPVEVAAARQSTPTPLPSAPGVCRTPSASVCCQNPAGAGPASGSCMESADACLKAGGTVSDAGVNGCA